MSIIQIVRLTKQFYQYGRGALVIDTWEISAYRINPMFNVCSLSSTCDQQHYHLPAHQCLRGSILHLLLCYQILAALLRSQAPAPTMVPHRRLCQHISHLWLQHRPHLPYDIHLNICDQTLEVFITGGSCLNRAPLYMATVVLNMATDIILLIFPIPMIVKL